MSAKLPALLLFIISAVACLPSCSLETTRDSVTREKLRKIAEILNECELYNPDKDNVECLMEYSHAKFLPFEAFITDAYGGKFVLRVSVRCAKVKFANIYSTGRNRIDECGGGDDISPSRW